MPYVETLTGEEIEFGRRFWQALRKQREFPVAGVLWLFVPETAGWHLLVATPVVDQIGARDAYRRLAEVTRSMPATSDELLKISLISPRDPLYAALRSVFGKTASVEGARLGHTQVDGVYVEGAYLYEVR